MNSTDLKDLNKTVNTELKTALDNLANVEAALLLAVSRPCIIHPTLTNSTQLNILKLTLESVGELRKTVINLNKHRSEEMEAINRELRRAYGERDSAETQRDNLLQAVAGTHDGRGIDPTIPDKSTDTAICIIRQNAAELQQLRTLEEIPFGIDPGHEPENRHLQEVWEKTLDCYSTDRITNPNWSANPVHATAEIMCTVSYMMDSARHIEQSGVHHPEDDEPDQAMYEHAIIVMAMALRMAMNSKLYSRENYKLKAGK